MTVEDIVNKLERIGRFEDGRHRPGQEAETARQVQMTWERVSPGTEVVNPPADDAELYRTAAVRIKDGRAQAHYWPD